MIHSLQDLSVERQFARLPSVQATANATKTLTVADAPLQIFTGTTAGQIVQMPDATTLIAGVMYEIANQSTAPIRVNDGALSPALLVWLSQGRRVRLYLQDNSTQGGVWIADANQSGANHNYNVSAGPTTNNSQVTYVSAVSFTTEILPPAEYELTWYSYFTVANNNRAADFQVLEGATQIYQQSFWIGPLAANGRVMAGGYFKRTLAAAGSFTYALQFRVGTSGGTTVTVNNSNLKINRL